MLTLRSILKTTAQMNAFGEGRHRFGKGTEPVGVVPRDKEAEPKAQQEE